MHYVAVRSEHQLATLSDLCFSISNHLGNYEETNALISQLDSQLVILNLTFLNDSINFRCLIVIFVASTWLLLLSLVN